MLNLGTIPKYFDTSGVFTVNFEHVSYLFLIDWFLYEGNTGI